MDKKSAESTPEEATPQVGAIPPVVPDGDDLLACAMGRRRLTRAQTQVNSLFLKFMHARYGAFVDLPEPITRIIYLAEGPDEDLKIDRLDAIMTQAGFPPQKSP